MAQDDAVKWLAIEVIYCPSPGACERVALQMAAGATLAEALRESGLLERHGMTQDIVRAGIWSKVHPHDALLRDHDRVEIYRPLTVDPKEARRLRYKRTRG